MARPQFAPALVALRRQLEEEAPHQDPWYYGIAPDWRHLLRRSAHNRGNALDSPTALLGLFRANQLIETIRYDAFHGRELRVSRMIWARRQCSPSTSWQWVRYRGNPHEKHSHIEVHEDQRDIAWRWRIR